MRKAPIALSLLLLGGALLLWKGMEKPYEVVVDEAGLTIENPDLAQRETRKIRLKNGLEALLISDPHTPQSGAALSVGVGSWQDPESALGMAHFVEHLLFLGTKKYPEEEALSRYLSEQGGKHNACTMNDRTIYMFSVGNGGFLGALDRLGQFFLSPLFSPSSIERERHAIHQEFCKDQTLDVWRTLFVTKEQANPHHPFHRFCIGNEESLGALSQKEIRAWFESHYTTDRMHLVVYSAEPLDRLEKTVHKLFSRCPRRTPLPASPSESIFSLAENPSPLIAIVPMQQLQTLELSWELPPSFAHDLDYHTDKLVGYLLGHEGATSLLANLKKEKWAECLRAGSIPMGNEQTLFTLSVQLTAEGVRAYEQVIQRVFEGIASLRASGIPHYLYDEMVSMEEKKYRFQSRGEIFDLVMEQAIELVDEPLATFPRKTLLPSVYNEERVADFLHLLSPSSCQFLLIADPQLSTLAPTRREQWLETEYTLQEIPVAQRTAWEEATPHPEITLPPPNPFIPHTLAAKAAKQATRDVLPLPHLALDTPLVRLYTCEDELFLIPKISWTFTLKSPLLSPSLPRAAASADLFCLIINETLAPLAYEASLGGLSHTLRATPHGIELTINGYEEKAAPFLAALLEKIAHFPPLTDSSFALYKDQLVREYSNCLTLSPLKQGKEVLWTILYKEYSGLSERREALDTLSLGEMEEFAHGVPRTLFLEGMLYGSQDATPVSSLFMKEFGESAPFLREEQPSLAFASLAKEHLSLSVPTTQPAHALILTVESPEFSFPRYAAQEILSKGLEEPFFTELRTRQQTAYLVTHWSQEMERHLYSFFAIQSSSHESGELLGRFETFLTTCMERLEEEFIPRARFEAIRASLIHHLENPVSSFSKMGELLHILARDYQGEFSWLEKRKEALRALTYEAFLGYAQECLGQENLRRLALCVEGPLTSPTHTAPSHTENYPPYEKVSTTDALRARIHYVPK